LYYMNPLVSVIIPTYNRATLLPRAIESVRQQTHENWELIVVDDGSQDGTEAVVKSLQDPRIRYERHEVNRGVSAARNTGLRLAQGQWVAFLDSDDYWRREKLAVQLETARNSRLKNVGIVLCAMEIQETGKTWVNVPKVRGNVFYKMLGRGTTVASGTPTYLVKHRPGQPIAVFDERISYGEDWDYVLAIARTYAVEFTPESLVKVERAHGMSRLMDADDKKRLEAFEHIVNKQSRENGNSRAGLVGNVFLARAHSRHWSNASVVRAKLKAARRYAPLAWQVYLLIAASYTKRQIFVRCYHWMDKLRLLPS
jgi:glycosyltransferase involved in cell wall biosynthesis